MMAASLPALRAHGGLHLPKPVLRASETSPGLRAWPKLGKHHLVLAAVAVGCRGRTLARTGRAGHGNGALVAQKTDFTQVQEDGNVQVPAGTHFFWNFAKAVEGRTFKRGEKIQSKMFTQLGVPDLQLELYPQGHTKASDGMMSLYLSAPEGSQLKYKATLGDVTKVSEMLTFEAVNGASDWGWRDFAPIGGSSIEIGVQILEVIPPKVFVWNFAKDMQSKLFDKGDEIVSPKFSQLGVPDLQVSLYPHGDGSADAEGHVSLFLHAPDGWQLKYKATLGKVTKVGEELHTFDGKGWGWSDFAPIRGSPTTVAIEVLEAISPHRAKARASGYREKRPEGQAAKKPAAFIWNFGEDIEGRTFDYSEWIESELFTLAGIPNLQLQLFPAGDLDASEGMMSLWFNVPSAWKITYKATLGDVTQTECRTDDPVRGWSDFAPIDSSSTEIVLEVLEATPL